MDKYTIAPPAGSTNNSVGAEDRPWHEGHFDALKLNGGDLGSYLSESTGYGIVSGCEPTISGLTVTVGAGIVHLAGGTRKEIVATNITLDAADSTNPRIDLVYIDSTGTVAKVTGTAAASPSAPSVPSGGISVCYINIEAGQSNGGLVSVVSFLPNYSKMRMVNVVDFGAVGDGINDDTLAIQSALDYIANAQKMELGNYRYGTPTDVLYFPKGMYKITNQLVVHGHLVIRGCGEAWQSGSIIRQTTNNHIFSFYGDLRTHYSVTAGISGMCFNLDNPLDDNNNYPKYALYFNDFDSINPSIAVKPSSVFIHNNFFGGYAKNGGFVRLGRGNDLRIDNNTIDGCLSYTGCILIGDNESATDIAITNNLFYGVHNKAIVLKSVKDVIVSNNNFDGVDDITHIPVTIDTSSDYTRENINIDGNNINYALRGIIVNSAENIDGLSITNNLLRNLVTYGVLFNCNDVVAGAIKIQNNVIKSKSDSTTNALIYRDEGRTNQMSNFIITGNIVKNNTTNGAVLQGLGTIDYYKIKDNILNGECANEADIAGTAPITITCRANFVFNPQTPELISSNNIARFYKYAGSSSNVYIFVFAKPMQNANYVAQISSSDPANIYTVSCSANDISIRFGTTTDARTSVTIFA